MAYEKQTWENNKTPVDASHLNHIEQGLYDHSIDTNNPHQVTKVQVGLGNADNTSDINKPVSGAQREAIDTSHMVNIIHAALVAKRNAGALVPGTQYRITDYVTTTSQAETQSAGHPFDIIVIADSTTVLNENTKAIQHDGDTYFANSKLSAWQLKYCLDNDSTRFAWASSSGKGVIYQMRDEFNNDVPYDFKNIQFKRKLTDGELDLDSGIDTWVYTFTMSDLMADKVVDISLKQNTEYMDDDGEYTQCANNVIKGAALDFQLDGLTRTRLNDNVFLNIFDDLERYLYYDCYSNTLDYNCYGNTFGNSCNSNNFGNSCNSNTFGNSCSFNTFGNGCYSNTLGNGCGSNTFGYSCSFNNFGYSCSFNTFGYSCGSNNFGYSCSFNTFGYSCYSNTFGYNCYGNTFGNSCGSNTFGNSCGSNTFGSDCGYLQISDVSTTAKNYISVDKGIKGASSANKFDLYDSAMLNKNYQVTFKKSASGKYLMLWATDTGTMTGKVKDSSTDTTWSDIV